MVFGLSSPVSRLRSVLVAAGLGLACGGPPMPPRSAPVEPTVSPMGPILVIGDTQRTSWAEAVIFGREQNETARRALIHKIALEERPAFVVHLGDLVVTGDSAREWEYFDRLMSPLTARRISILPVLGNHDYWGEDHAALRQARARFPQLAPHGYYARRHGRLGLIWLDSNLADASGREQGAWFGRALSTFEADPGVHGVLVFTHHPPFTNGKQRSGDAYVLSELLPRFRRAPKARVMLSGHVHGYERFIRYWRTFIVTGGAGGPRVEYRIGGDVVTAPAYSTPTGKVRAFHYVAIRDARTALEFEVKCLALDAPCPGGVLERFSVALPAP
jgi:3',5'-cyclic AMP phosphodiesterase CpdA